MSRPPRIDLMGYWYHIIARGNARKKIFREISDYQYYLSLLDKTLYNNDGILGCFCLMPNHVHLLIYRGNTELHKIIHGVHSKYSHTFNLKYKRVGHLFQNRYKSLMVLDDRYLKNLLIYFHNNPRKAGLVKKDKPYLWSSEQYYLGKPIQQKSFKLVPGFENTKDFRKYQDLLNNTTELKIPIYKSFIGSEDDAKKISKRKLGRDSKFRYERREKNTMTEIVAKIANASEIPLEKLKGKSRERKISTVRKQIIQMMLANGYGASEISRFFGRVPSYIIEIAKTITE